MAYVNVAEWKPEQVTEWLKGLDNAVLAYIHSFLNNEVNGQQLLNLRSDDLDHLGVHKLGHQEIILEAVEHLSNFHYELDRENLQLLALRLSCRARSLYSELLQHTDSQPVSTQTLADVANIITAVKPIACWLDRSPFTGQLDYHRRKMALLELSLEIATCAQRDRFAERPVEEIRASCEKLSCQALSIIRDIGDPLVLQPASLDLATLKKKAGDDLGFFILPSFHGVHQIGQIKFSSPAHQCGKIEEGDEIVQVNYQTVVGWQTKKVMFLLEESPTDVFLTLKKRPRHTKVYGQIYMKPYRLPSKKRAAPYTRWHDNLPSPRPELLTIPDFDMPLRRSSPKPGPVEPVDIPLLEPEPLAGSSSSDDDDDETFLPGAADLGHASPTSMRLYLPKQRSAVQRRATVTGASPTTRRPPVNIDQLWHEMRLKRQGQGGVSAGNEGTDEDLCQLRDKSSSVADSLGGSTPRPSTCLGIERTNRLPKKTICVNTDLEETCNPIQSDCEDSEKSGESRTNPRTSSSSDLPISESEDRCSTTECDNQGFQTTFQQTKSPPFLREEMKIVLTNDEGKVFSLKERGRLDKSYSTPAYDLSDCDQNDLLKHTQKKLMCGTNDLDLANKSSAEKSVLRNLQSEEVQGQLSDDVRSDLSDCVTDQIQTDISSAGDKGTIDLENDLIEDKETQRIGQILEAINIDLLHHRLREQENMERRKNRVVRNEKSAKANLEDTQVTDSCAGNDIFEVGAASNRTSSQELNSHFLVSQQEACADIKQDESDDDPVKPVPHPRTLQVDNFVNVKHQAVNQNIVVHVSCEENETTCQPTMRAVPPEPPPRPDQPRTSPSVNCKSRLVSRPVGRTGSNRCAGVLSAPSPRTMRKINALLARRRNVSARELGSGSCEGWLLHRSRSVGGGGGATWVRAWFVLKGTAFYGFKTPQSTRADVLIALPGFTASVAEEVKSKKFAFKIYHTGTVFYFAAETEEERSTWLDSITLVTVLQEPNKTNASDGVCFSETDEESEAKSEAEPETCFPSPKMRKFAGLLGGSGVTSTSRSQQNLASEAKTSDIQKKFGSLKKLGRKVTEPNSSSNSPAHTEVSASAASLDRKYLRFLGGGRCNMVPVPTAQFRSYRRVPASPQSKMPTELYGQKILERTGRIGCDTQEHISSNTSESKSLARESKSPETSPSSRSQFFLSAESVLVQEGVTDQELNSNIKTQVSVVKERAAALTAEKPKHQDRLSRSVKTEFRDRQIHASNPSLQLPADMADYRLARERLREFGIRRNRQREDTSGFVTLEEFMLSRQEEERQSANTVHRNQMQGNDNGQLTVDSQSSSENSITNTPRGNKSRGTAAPVARRGSLNSTRHRRVSNSDLTYDVRQREYRGGSPEKLWIDSLRRNDDFLRKVPNQGSQKNNEGHSPSLWVPSHLKSAAQYQPPPVSQPEETSRMKLAFEMHLGEKDSKTSKFRSLFSSSKSQQQLEVPSAGTLGHHQKTLLGSPRLHRAIFKEKRHASQGSTSESSSSSLASPASPPFATASNDWSPEGFSDTSLAQIKPTMGISMLGKKPSRRLPPTSPLCVPASPPPDYPGLEYPPVFEPETYTLLDASSLRSRQSRSHTGK